MMTNHLTISIKMKSTYLIFVLHLLNISVFCQEVNNRPKDWATKISDTKFTNLCMLNDSIYRSEQPDSIGFILLQKKGISSVLDLRAHHSDNDLIYKLPLHLYHVDMSPFHFGDEEIIDALRILKDAPKPIDVHCQFGSDRTGVVIAMYRIIFQGWEKEKAIEELKNGGYGFHKFFRNIPRYIRKANVDLIHKEVLN